MAKVKIIYTHVGLSSFVKKDIEILQEIFDLKIYHFNVKSKSGLLLSFFKQFWWLLFNLPATKGTVTQFAGYQSYLPAVLGKLFKRKTVLVLGGTDTVSFPSIQYGCFYNKKLARFTKTSLLKATLLLPVSESLIDYEYTYTSEDFDRQGYKFHVPSVNTPVQTIYNGYKSEKWVGQTDKEKLSFLTIGANLASRFGVKLKGIDLILEIATKFPNAKFYIIGGQSINEKVPENVILVPNMANEKLPEFIGNKQFYLQLSMSEGFPNALSEAMLCGCVPIVSNVGAMPMIVGDEGYILKSKNSDELESLIQVAIQEYNSELPDHFRNRIIENFPFEKRKQELQQAISLHFLA